MEELEYGVCGIYWWNLEYTIIEVWKYMQLYLLIFYWKVMLGSLHIFEVPIFRKTHHPLCLICILKPMHFCNVSAYQFV